MKTLTPEQATRIVENGGLVISGRELWWHDGTELRDQQNMGNFGGTVQLADCLPHPAYPPDIFARKYPLTLPGPEAKALLMTAPVGMLWGCNTTFKGDFELGAEYWDGAKLDGECMQVRWNWRDNETYEIRIRPGWLESQREKFARGEFGEKHEPWRCATLATGYVWDGKQVAEALRAGMEGRLDGWTDGSWMHKTGNSFRINQDGPWDDDTANRIANINNWALRWPAKENTINKLDLSTFPKIMTGEEAKALIMSQPAGLLEGQYVDANWGHKRDDGTFYDGTWLWNSDSFTVRVGNAAAAAGETLTAGQALDALIAGQSIMDNKGHIAHPRHIDVVVLKDLVHRAPFTRVPAKPTSKTLTVQGITLAVYADKATYGEWTVSRGVWENAASVMKMLGPDDSWTSDKGALEGAGFRSVTATQAGLKVGCKTYRTGDVANIIAAMDEIAEGGEG